MRPLVARTSQLEKCTENLVIQALARSFPLRCFTHPWPDLSKFSAVIISAMRTSSVMAMYRFKGRWAKFVVQTTLCCSKYKIQVISGGSSSVLFVLSVERMLGVAVFPRRNISTVRR